jgi:hypothetical protein
MVVGFTSGGRLRKMKTAIAMPALTSHRCAGGGGRRPCGWRGFHFGLGSSGRGCGRSAAGCRCGGHRGCPRCGGRSGAGRSFTGIRWGSVAIPKASVTRGRPLLRFARLWRMFCGAPWPHAADPRRSRRLAGQRPGGFPSCCWVASSSSMERGLRSAVSRSMRQRNTA